ncbi:hypothetical protein [Coleofasciculus sp.]|uniref:hypothetical protein n=1 Tax=Coleofasciculus sp. TaxID=3100458 RepID=UPI003A1C16BA
MSSRRQVRKRASLEPKTTPVNPLRTRGFGKGIPARNAQLPHGNPLQTRPFGAQKPGLSQKQETHSIQEQKEQKEGTEQFGYNAANIPAYAPERSQLPIQTKVGQFGGWNPPPIQRVDPVKNRLNLWRDQQLDQAETGESEEVSEREEQEASPEAAVVQRLQESDTQPISDQGIQPQEIAEPEDKNQPTPPPKTETIQPKSVSVAKTISPQTKAQLRRKLFPESQDETEKIPEFSTNVDRDQQSSSVIETHNNPLAKAKQFANLPAKVARNKKPLTSLKTNRSASLPQTFKPSEADQLIEPGDTAAAKGVTSSPNRTPLPDAGGVPHPQPSEAKKAGADEAVSEPPLDKPEPEAVSKSTDTGTPPLTAGNSESDQTTPTEVATESPTSTRSTQADTPTPQPGANPEKSGQEAAPKLAIQPDAGSVQSPETKTNSVAAPAAAISSPAAAGGGGGAGAAVGASAGGGDVEAATVDEEAEANAMEKRLAEVAPETDTESQQLSSAEKDVALAALAEEPATGSLPTGGGGGGGAIAESAPPPAPPDVSQADPAAALGAVSGLPPAQLVSALGGVTAAVSNDVGKQKSELAANQPSADTLAGTGKSAVVKADSGGDKPKPVAKKAEGQEKPVPEPKPLPPEKAPPQVSTPAPAVQGNEEGKLSDADISNMKASVTRLPVSDPGANQVSAGLPPKLALEGNADPQKAQEQRAELETSLTEAQVKGQQELAKPTGVENIQPTIPQKSLKAQIPGGAGGGAAGAAAGAGAALATGAGGDGMGDAASIFAQQEKGGEIQAAAAQAQSDLAAKKQDHATKVAEEQATAKQEVEQLKKDNIAQQAQERTKAKGEVAELQGQWSKEQDDLVSQSRQEGDKLVSEGLQEVETKQAEGDAEAVKEIEKGETEAEAERQKGEAKAAEEKQKGEEESGGLFGWLASKAKAFFDGIKKAIKKAFEAARAAMRKAIEAAKKLAAAAIEKARQGIVAVIRRVGDALIALGDTLLAKWPGLRDKWRSAIEKKVQQAEDTVNQLAENLNQGIQKALDVLGGALDAALGLLEKGMLAVVSVYEGVVMGAIKLGEGIAKALGAFAVLAKDIAANPGQWIGNLGAAVSDGIRNHLWSAFKEQVQTWFNQKLEAVLGLGAAVWKILTQGGIAMAEVGKMAWTAVKQALPTIIIGVLLERLVSMIVPAAGAVLAIIQGLQAAWGTVSQIIQAFGRFIEFLKAIKTGAAGPQFGALLASAAIVLLDFITNFIIVKIAKAARKVAGKLKGLAKSLMKRFKGKKGKKDKSKKGKKGNQDKKKDQDEDKALRPIAQKVAQQGWKKTQKLTRKQVQPESVVKSQLSQVPARKSGASIKTTLLTRGSMWMIESIATKQGKRAKAMAGKGWVAKDVSGKKYYAGINNSSLHRQILQDTAATLNQSDKGGDSDLRSAYDRKIRLAKRLEQQGQQKIDKRIKGIKFSVNLEAYEGVKNDQQIRTKMTISPNVEELETNITLDDHDNNFNDLAQAIQRSTGLKKTYKVIDEIDRLVDAIVGRVNANRSNPDQKIVPTLQVVNDTVVGGVSHKFMFKMQKHTGRPAFLEVQRLSGNTACASCQAQPGVTTPHNVVTAAHAKAEINDALKIVLGSSNFSALPNSQFYSQLYSHMRGLAESTSAKVGIATGGQFQKQCIICEGNAAGDDDGKFLAAQSLNQRAAGTTAPTGGATAASRGMDKQFQTTTTTGRKDITNKRINNFISALERDLSSSTYASTDPLNILITNPTKRAVFLGLLRRKLKDRVK